MRYVRYTLEDEPPRWGRVEGRTIFEMNGAPYAGGRETGVTVSLDHVELLAPVEPSKIVCVGRNYAEHAKERGSEIPKEPMLFFKAPSALIGHGECIVIPNREHTIHWEAELAVVIGKRARRVSEDEAMNYVFGYTIANDVSDRTLQKADLPFGFGRAKNFDTFCPCGPALVTDLPNPMDVTITLTCNEEVRQSDSTALMLFTIPQLISFISHIMTLMPGDMILTGTPKGVGEMKAGDLIEITVPGIGTLSNSVC